MMLNSPTATESDLIEPIHPGEVLLEEFIEGFGITGRKLAVSIGIPSRRINQIVHGKRGITADTAIRLARYFGTSEEFWTNLQSNYELRLERHLLRETVAAITPPIAIGSAGLPHNRVMGGATNDDPGASDEEQAAVVCALSDPELRAYDHGLGTLSVDGEIKGYLASVVGTMRFPSAQLWPWFVVVWADGSKENPFEDYGPSWVTVRELDAGYLQHQGPSRSSEQRFLGMRFAVRVPSAPCRFEFEWLPPAEAASKWQELGLVESDF